jgi:hypothetical protein
VRQSKILLKNSMIGISAPFQNEYAIMKALKVIVNTSTTSLPVVTRPSRGTVLQDDIIPYSGSPRRRRLAYIAFAAGRSTYPCSRSFSPMLKAGEMRMTEVAAS